MDLKVYLATSAACLAVGTFSYASIIKDIKSELEERGYTVVQDKLKYTDYSIKDYILALLVDLTPLIRFITPVTLVLYRKKLVELIIASAIKDGLVTKTDEKKFEEDIESKKARLLAFKEKLAEAGYIDYDYEVDSFGDTPAKGFSH